ncbi:UNVERIFIED_CONTAM: hypothetical protein RMT77_019201 [Armadillidium vulgare]
MVDQALSFLEDSKQPHLESKESNKRSNTVQQSSFNKQRSMGTEPIASTILTTTGIKSQSSQQTVQSSDPSSQNTGSKVITCRFCKGPHYPSECTLLPTPELREQVVRAQGWCERCLAQTHTTANCKNMRPCLKCQATDHHVVFCRNKGNQRANASQQTRPASPLQESANNLTAQLSTNRLVALPLADLSVVYKGGKTIPVRTLYDQGSQRSLVSRSVVKALQCVLHSKIDLTINGINQKGIAMSHDVVTLKIKTNDRPISVSAIVVDHLPTDICIPGLAKTTKLLRKHRVSQANPYPIGDKVSDLSLLIGSDYLKIFF